MLTSKEIYIKVDALNVYELNAAHRDGYVIVAIVYNEIVERHPCTEREPIPHYGSSAGGTYNNNYHSSPQYRLIEKEVPVVIRTPVALMKLGPAAEVIYGKDT